MAPCNYISIAVQSLPSSVHIAIAALLTTLIPTTIAMNSILIAALTATKQVAMNTMNFLLVCLSVSDILNGFLPMLFLAVWFYGHQTINNCIFENLTLSSISLFYSISSMLTVLMAVDRYLHMNPDIERRSRLAKFFERPKIYYAVVVLLLPSIPVFLLFALLDSSAQIIAGILNLAYAAFDILLLSVISLLYIRGYLRIRRFTIESPVYTANNAASTKPQYVRSLFKTVLLLIIAQLVTYTPMAIASFALAATMFLKRSARVNALFLYTYISRVIMFANGVINSAIIFYHNKKARKWVQQKFSLQKTRTVGFERERELVPNMYKNNGISTEAVAMKNITQV